MLLVAGSESQEWPRPLLRKHVAPSSSPTTVLRPCDRSHSGAADELCSDDCQF